jgi:hypothetical protein
MEQVLEVPVHGINNLCIQSSTMDTLPWVRFQQNLCPRIRFMFVECNLMDVSNLP